MPLPVGRIGLARETFFIADVAGAAATPLTPAPAAPAPASSTPAAAPAAAAPAPAAGHAFIAALGAGCLGTCCTPVDVGVGRFVSKGGPTLSAGDTETPVGEAAAAARAMSSYDGGRTIAGGRGGAAVCGSAAPPRDCRGGVGAVVDGGLGGGGSVSAAGRGGGGGGSGRDDVSAGGGIGVRCAGACRDDACEDVALIGESGGEIFKEAAFLLPVHSGMVFLSLAVGTSLPHLALSRQPWEQKYDMYRVADGGRYVGRGG